MNEDLVREGKLLPLVEEFYSIQGEGFHTGKAAYFIRLGGCDIGCSWCDTKYSWNSELCSFKLTDDIIAKIVASPAKSVVVTGGEPSLYNMEYLCSKLKENNIITFLETSGTNPLTGKWDWICLSPKQSNPPIERIYSQTHELKVIIASEDDISWAELNACKVSADCHLFLQPEWSARNTFLPFIIEYIKNTPKWKISLQMHKYIGIP